MDAAEIIGQVAGYLVGLLIGIVMGLIGGGGSILLPVFVYLFDIPVVMATAYTLVLVGVTAAVGVWFRRGRGEIDMWTAATLGLPVLAGTLLVRAWLIHVIPDTLMTIGDFKITKQLIVFSIFSLILMLSFASMKGLIGRRLKPRPNFRSESPTAYFVILIASGLFIGVLSGFVGAGGGVMIVPLLVIVMGIPMKTVVGTSLAIMAFKSTLGFIGDIYQNGTQIDWKFLIGFGIVMTLGIFAGSLLSRQISSKMLKNGFAWFILTMAVFIILKESLFPT